MGVGGGVEADPTGVGRSGQEVAGPGWLWLMSTAVSVPAGLLTGTNEGSRAHVAGACWGWALGRIESVQCPAGLSLYPVLSQQPQPGWAGPSRVCSLPCRPLSQSDFQAEPFIGCQANAPDVTPLAPSSEALL